MGNIYFMTPTAEKSFLSLWLPSSVTRRADSESLAVETSLRILHKVLRIRC